MAHHEVEHIKEWLEKKKREDELVNLLTGEGPELPKPTSETATGRHFLVRTHAFSRKTFFGNGNAFYCKDCAIFLLYHSYFIMFFSPIANYGN